MARRLTELRTIPILLFTNNYIVKFSSNCRNAETLRKHNHTGRNLSDPQGELTSPDRIAQESRLSRGCFSQAHRFCGRAPHALKQLLESFNATITHQREANSVGRIGPRGAGEFRALFNGNFAGYIGFRAVRRTHGVEVEPSSATIEAHLKDFMPIQLNRTTAFSFHRVEIQRDSGSEAQCRIAQHRLNAFDVSAMAAVPLACGVPQCETR